MRSSKTLYAKLQIRLHFLEVCSNICAVLREIRSERSSNRRRNLIAGSQRKETKQSPFRH